jgi:hypothetical protein
VAFDPITRHTILQIALFLSACLGGVLAYAYRLPFGRIGLAVAVAAAVLMLATTVVRMPVLMPVPVIGLVFTFLAGRSVLREQAQRDPS